MFEDKRQRRRTHGVLLSETEDTCLFCKKFSPSSHPVGYIRMRHLMNHYVERHGFRLDPRGPDGQYFYESVDGEPRFFLASRRRLKNVDPIRRRALNSSRMLSRPLSSDAALILSTDEMGYPVAATVTDVSDLAAWAYGGRQAGSSASG
jgi:hypothetical protein